jgi:hypothetical protein
MALSSTPTHNPDSYGGDSKVFSGVRPLVPVAAKWLPWRTLLRAASRLTSTPVESFTGIELHNMKIFALTGESACPTAATEPRPAGAVSPGAFTQSK